MDVKTINQKFEYQYTGGIHVYPVFRHNEGEMLGSHWHEELEIVYTFYGNNEHFINGERFVSSPGQILVVNSNFVHSIIPQEIGYRKDILKVVVIIISKAFLDINFPQYADVYFTNEKTMASPKIDELILEILQCADGTTDNPDRRLHRNAMILELLSFLYAKGVVPREQIESSEEQQDVEKIKEIVSYIEEHYAERISRQDVADHFYLSQNYFSTYFKKYVGMTFTQYLTTYRLSRAKELLEKTEMPIGQIAMECGFSDHRSFIAAFKGKFEETPYQYRKERENASEVSFVIS